MYMYIYMNTCTRIYTHVYKAMHTAQLDCTQIRILLDTYLKSKEKEFFCALLLENFGFLFMFYLDQGAMTTIVICFIS